MELASRVEAERRASAPVGPGKYMLDSGGLRRALLQAPAKQDRRVSVEALDAGRLARLKRPCVGSCTLAMSQRHLSLCAKERSHVEAFLRWMYSH